MFRAKMLRQIALIWSLAVCVFAVYSNDISLNATKQNAWMPAKVGDEVCMKELGCFAITKDFFSWIHRPINALPQDQASINAKYDLYTRKFINEPRLLNASDPSSIKESKYNPKHPTKIIIHGFVDRKFFGDWMLQMKDEFLLHGEYNIIIVDWSSGNKPPYYQAVANARVVAAEVALVVEALEKHFGAKREKFHIIGHSLGSHIAGYVGERLKRLGRITGCDPAGPYFTKMPPSVRLDPTDADFVDVIHSDSHWLTGFGMIESLGHVDFFPNNGRKQIGCKTEMFFSFVTDGFGKGLKRFGACDHLRSLDYMHHSINLNRILPVGYECSNWKSFLRGECADCGKDTSQCAIMGFKADEYHQFRNTSKTRKMYLKTSGQEPFWLYHYQITVKTYKPTVPHKNVKLTLEVTLFGTLGDHLFKVQDKAVEYYPGEQYKYLVTTKEELGDIKKVSYKWYSASRNPWDWIYKPKLYIEYIIVMPMNVIEKSPRSTKNREFCGDPETGVKPKTTTILHRNDNCMI